MVGEQTRPAESVSAVDRVSDEYFSWLTLEILRWNLKTMVDAPKFHWLKIADMLYNCPLNDIDDALGQFKFRNAADAERYLGLVKQYAVIVRQLESKLHEQRRQGIVLPKDELKVVEPTFLP